MPRVPQEFGQRRLKSSSHPLLSFRRWAQSRFRRHLLRVAEQWGIQDAVLVKRQ